MKFPLAMPGSGKVPEGSLFLGNFQAAAAQTVVNTIALPPFTTQLGDLFVVYFGKTVINNSNVISNGNLDGNNLPIVTQIGAGTASYGVSKSCILAAELPAGPHAGALTINMNASFNGVSFCGAWVLKGLTNRAAAAVFGTDTGNPLSIAMATPAKGIMIGGQNLFLTGGFSDTTFAGDPNIVEDWDVYQTANTNSNGGFHIVGTAPGTTTITMTRSRVPAYGATTGACAVWV